MSQFGKPSWQSTRTSFIEGNNTSSNSTIDVLANANCEYFPMRFYIPAEALFRSQLPYHREHKLLSPLVRVSQNALVPRHRKRDGIHAPREEGGWHLAITFETD